MSFLRCAFVFLVCVGPASSQPYGLTSRPTNTSLRLPSTPPTYSYAVTNAFGNTTFPNPVAMTAPPGEVNRLFIAEQAGRISVISNLTAPTRAIFLDLSSRVIGGGEQGLLGLAFHPGYATNGYFFVFYTDDTTTRAGTGRHQVLARFQVSSNNPNAALATSEVTLLTMFDEHTDHNGGDLHFGPDGFLYVSLGDEGDQNDSLDNSQRIDKDFWSSILRLDVDEPARPSSLLPNPHPANTNHAGRAIHYRIPADNPFVGATSFNGVPVNPANVRTEMFAVGFRNPWRFSIDPVTGRIFCGDVGGDLLEEISVVTRGGNYGWAFREGTNAGPKSATQPGGLALIPPIFTYRHGNATNQGNAVIGGRVYRGSRIPALQGSYIFGDYASGNIWSLRYDGTNVSGFMRIADDPGIAAFGVDPSNGDILVADQGSDDIRRLIAVPAPASPPPQTLEDAGVFSSLATLTPQTGFVPYEINHPFWSDNAIKSRWFYVPPAVQITFAATNNWAFPTGTVWVKHFDLETTNGVPSSRRRIETRLLVRHHGSDGSDVYGLTYRWNGSTTNATLVPEGGLDETFLIHDAGTVRTQLWRYPGRSECLLCHTRASQGGLAIGFNTPQLHREFNYGGVSDNQLRAMSHAGYFSAPVTNLHSLRALAQLDDESVSVEQRVRSYLAANCSPCHQPGGNGWGQFDARYFTPLSATRLIHGGLYNPVGNPDSVVVHPGRADLSVLLTRISTLETGRRMPPIGSSVRDTQAIALITRWITNDLASYRTFAQWQADQFGSTNAAAAQPQADPDGDAADNWNEHLTGTAPGNANSFWRIGIDRDTAGVAIRYETIPNRLVTIEWREEADSTSAWQFLDLFENRPNVPANAFIHEFIDPASGNTPRRVYRARVIEP